MTAISTTDILAQRAKDRARPPWPHQTEAKKKMAIKPAFYLAMEPRCGKTRPILEEAATLYKAGIINALLIMAMPSGAPRNWTDDEIPLWIPDDIPVLSLLWKANKTKLKSFAALQQELLTFRGLSVLAINGEGVITPTFKKYIGKFLNQRKTYTVGDETTLLCKSPGAKRTKTMYSIAGHSIIRRALDGTPVGEGPMDLYSQYTFLDPDILGYTSFYAFRNRYAILEKQKNWSTGIEYEAIKVDEETGEKMYQNLDELQQKIEPYTFRVLFKDVFPNVPEPIYSKNYFELHPKQRVAYDQMKEEFETELQGLGQVTAAHVLTRYLRLQQITSGYWPAQKKQPSICPGCDGDGCTACGDLGVLLANTPLNHIVSFKENPRIEAMHEELMQAPQPAIIWARFNEDIDNCMQLCEQMKRKPVQYDGRVDEEQKYINKTAFQTGAADTIIAKTSSMGRAVRADAAHNMFFYTNEFSLLKRLQGEMRTETGDRVITTTITDLVAEQTLDDELLIPALRSKKRIADLINQDKNGRWL